MCIQAWLAIDTEGGGVIGKSEFRAFFRLGDETGANRTPWRERLAGEKKKNADEVRHTHV